MKVFKASYYENGGVWFAEYERVVVAESDFEAIETLLANEPHTNIQFWVLSEIDLDRKHVVSISDNYSD